MENYVHFELLGYHWTVKPAFAEIIREDVIPLVLSGEDSPRLRPITRKPLRDSFIVCFDDTSPEMFVKVHKYARLAERMKTIFRPSRAKAEWTIGEQMYEHGLCVAEPLGFGERRRGNLVTGCILIQRAIPRCETLGSYLLREGREPHFLNRMGQILRQVHSAGFRHPDLHTGNILVEPETNPPRLWLVDLHAAGKNGGVSERGRMADLAKLVFSLQGFLDESQLREVVAGYVPGNQRENLEPLFSKLLAAADRLRRRRLRSRSKRCLKTSGRFVVEKSGNQKIYRNRNFDGNAVLSMVEKHKEIFLAGGPGLTKKTPKSVVTSFPISNGSGETVYVKEFANRGFIRLMETIFYVPRGRRAWKTGHRLQLQHVPCAEPIALVDEFSRGFLRTSYVIMREIPDAMRLNLFLHQRYFRASGRLGRGEISEKRELIRTGAHALREFHAKNIYHKDLSAKNVLIRTNESGGTVFYCVDTDSMQFPRRLSLRRRTKNLAQLNGLPTCITMIDRLRFYKEYFGLERITRKHRLLLFIIRLRSFRRFNISRKIDRRLRESASPGAESYEDITSL